jgi:hypothetical protein
MALGGQPPEMVARWIEHKTRELDLTEQERAHGVPVVTQPKVERLREELMAEYAKGEDQLDPARVRDLERQLADLGEHTPLAGQGRLV